MSDDKPRQLYSYRLSGRRPLVPPSNPYRPPGTEFQAGGGTDPAPKAARVLPTLSQESHNEARNSPQLAAVQQEASRAYDAFGGHLQSETRAFRNNIRTALESASEHSGLSTPDSTTAAENGKKLAREAVSLEKEFEQLSAEQKSTHKGSNIVHELVSICLALRSELVNK